jgi:hypothetical protein
MKILRELDIKKNSLLVPLITLILIFLSVTTQMAIDNRTEINMPGKSIIPQMASTGCTARWIS